MCRMLRKLVTITTMLITSERVEAGGGFGTVHGKKVRVYKHYTTCQKIEYKTKRIFREKMLRNADHLCRGGEGKRDSEEDGGGGCGGRQWDADGL